MIIVDRSTTVWYHGDTSKRTHFNDQAFQDVDDPNAMGPGIYFTNNIDTARGYATAKGYVYTAHVDGPFVTDESIPPIALVRRFIQALPMDNQETLFSCWDENPRSAMNALLASVQRQGDNFTSTFADIGKQAGLDYLASGREWCKHVSALGFSGFIHKLPAETHLIVWKPSSIHTESVARM